MNEPKIITVNGRQILGILVLASLSLAILFTYIGALQAFIAPTNNYPLKVADLDTLDATNGSSSSFSRGDLVRVNITVEMATAYYFNFPISYNTVNFLSDTTYRVIVTIIDPSNMPVFSASESSTVSSGGTNVFTYDYSVSTGAVLGAYKVRVMVWSDWLPDGLALSESAMEVIFNVS